ncbi:MAG TPA: Ig-like domain-containing protein, partial [Pyrinomonadaceae bacterium]|nr:Ig-like domain-containing protein [Pyrinomonadaceae bacterium]
MPRSSRYALSVFLFSVLVFAGLAVTHPRGVGASSVDSDRTGARVFTTGHADAHAAYLLSFDPSRPLFSTPSIGGVMPTTVTRSGLLRVAGVGFGATQGTSQLLIDGKTPTFIAHWSDTLIIAYVPEDATLGDVAVSVTNADGTDDATVNVTERQSNGRIRWSFNVASDSVQRRAAVASDGTIYLNDIAGRLYALAPDGALKWVFNAGGGGARGTVSVGDDGTVYAAGSVAKDPAQTCATPDLETVDAIFAVNPDGTQKWLFDETCQRLLAGPMVGPDGKVYAVTDKGGIGAFALYGEDDDEAEVEAGTLAWSGGTFSDEGGAVGSEIVFGPTVAGGTTHQEYFQFSQTGVDTQGRLFGYTLAGSEVFQKATDAGGQPSVGITNSDLFITTHGGAGAQVRSYTPQGALRWTSNIFPESSLSSLDSGPGDSIYVTQDDTFLHSLTPTSGGIKWTFYDASATFFSPVASPDARLALVGGRNTSDGAGVVYAVGVTGRLVWKQQLPGDLSLFPAGQAVPNARPRFTSFGETAYVSADVAGDDARPEAERQSLFFTLDTSGNDILEELPPTVTLTNPPNGANVAQNTTIQLTAEVQNEDLVERVDFYRIAGGTAQLLGSDDDAPYSVPFNTGKAGTFAIQAVAANANGLTGQSTRNTLNVVNEGPHVSFVTPSDGDTFPSGSPITITIHATDIDGHVTKVEFFSSRAGALGEDTTPDADGNYSVEYTPVESETSHQEGTQQIYANPTDNDGARGSAFVNITVYKPPPTPEPTPTPEETPTPSPTPTPEPTPTPGPTNAPPTVRIVSPAHGSSFPAGTLVQVS